MDRDRAVRRRPAVQPRGGGLTIPAPTVSVTRHSGTFGGQAVAYTAIAGETYLKADDGTPRASIFSTSYLRDGNDPKRPVTFLFNGGPGSSSVWLHLGLLGPRRVQMGDVGSLVNPPYGITDNLESLLRVSDLVFIDPPYDVSEDALAVVLGRLRAGWLAPGGLVVVERSTRSPEPTWPDGIHRSAKPKKYGETTVWYATRD